MTFVITQPCVDVQDQSCVEVCPVDCIQFEEGSDRMLYIDPTTCIDCGACEPACPVTAIFAEADVPADQARFIEINALWYDDHAAARARLGGEAAPAAPAAPAEEPAAAEEAPAAEAETATEAPAAVEAEEAPAAAAAEEAPVAMAAVGPQVEAMEPHVHHDGVVASQYRLPSPVSLIALAGLAFSLVLIWLAPGPNFGLPDLGILRSLEGPSKLGTVVGVPLAVIFFGLFLFGEGRVMRTFAAHRDLPLEPWREPRPVWRRSEEMRRYELERAVLEVARDRFAFPSDRHPDYETHVNLPQPTLALEFTAGGATTAKVFPDIVVTSGPAGRPVMVAQVETRETVTRKQAQLVWAPLETQEAPLYLYVPSGLAGRARDYARAAGIEHVRIRTWRRLPAGMQVAEVS